MGEDYWQSVFRMGNHFPNESVASNHQLISVVPSGLLCIQTARKHGAVQFQWQFELQKRYIVL